MYPDHSPEQPSQRPIIAFFDVDNTLLHGAGIYHVGRAAWKAGYIGFRDISRFAWQQFRFVAVGENKKHILNTQERALQLAEGHPADELRRLAEDIYERELETRLWPETVTIAREHLDKGHEVWLITAAPVDVAAVIARKLGLTGALGTLLSESDGKFTGEFDGPILHGDRKAEAAEALAAKLGADLADCWAYSDSRNDIPLLELVGNRVVVNPDAGLSSHAKERGWPVMKLDPASIRAARRRVRRDAKAAGGGEKRSA
ncbi:HAD-IB family hydrolase [Glaciihabitans sp. UYNi722]|uniref:HAD family hydrolase n=1 Tax=Glaciihabitans sp. UYNi722 TaxID=3156344 RepID=UPI00339331FB